MNDPGSGPTPIGVAEHANQDSVDLAVMLGEQGRDEGPPRRSWAPDVTHRANSRPALGRGRRVAKRGRWRDRATQVLPSGDEGRRIGKYGARSCGQSRGTFPRVTPDGLGPPRPTLAHRSRRRRSRAPRAIPRRASSGETTGVHGRPRPEFPTSEISRVRVDYPNASGTSVTCSQQRGTGQARKAAPSGSRRTRRRGPAERFRCGRDMWHRASRSSDS